MPGSALQQDLRATDVEAVREQLGREPTTPFTIAARCTGGHPLVIRNDPFGADGAPFPTTFWLSCPDAAKAVSAIESDGWIARLNERYEQDAAFRTDLDRAHTDYAAERAEADERGRDLAGVGGTRRGVKCLHAHYAYRLAGGDDPVGAWVAERVEPVHPEQRAGRVAVVDQGTNSLRLLVFEPGAGGEAPTELARDMVITRLGQGVDATGRLAPAALGRTDLVLGRYCRRARALGAERIRVAATSAVRDASNRADYEAIVRRHAGVAPEVIDGEQEAAISFLGGTLGLEAAAGPFVVMDIGGGSTELVIGAVPGRADHALSTQLGSVRLTERAIAHDPPTPEDLEAVEAIVRAGLDDVEAAVPVRDGRTFVSVAGTATTLQAIALGLERYDPDLIHRSWLSVEDARRVLAHLAGMTNAERAAIPVMVPGRGDVIVAGAVILVTVMRRFGWERTLVSETDILDGLAFELLGVR
jgi:exopolyphosphatase/guanosine-5'-triphosphate,3'-diphosphate pyrophosphatase